MYTVLYHIMYSVLYTVLYTVLFSICKQMLVKLAFYLRENKLPISCTLY